ncbi:hypothetical protein P154DRAFT_622860 [Amniculicola lignicola CBS 123094]|uniref:Uncharacterized protein n=1 Tax=Amniculicola lignicola CBS 123094 TaxID=1392246 RepID=A0A6A5WCR3_9PLEO|nr:hypothetical protein P154DRAFT_622860 [Amniculicola lignicola CBS 123094]
MATNQVMQQSPFFTQLNSDVRHMIYDIILYDKTLPIECAGFIQSCRTAYEEMTPVVLKHLDAFLRKREQVITDFGLYDIQLPPPFKPSDPLSSVWEIEIGVSVDLLRDLQRVDLGDGPGQYEYTLFTIFGLPFNKVTLTHVGQWKYVAGNYGRDQNPNIIAGIYTFMRLLVKNINDSTSSRKTQKFYDVPEHLIPLPRIRTKEIVFKWDLLYFWPAQKDPAKMFRRGIEFDQGKSRCESPYRAAHYLSPVREEVFTEDALLGQVSLRSEGRWQKGTFQKSKLTTLVGWFEKGTRGFKIQGGVDGERLMDWDRGIQELWATWFE